MKKETKKVIKKKEKEGAMIRLTRWMVARYLPKHSIYKTRPPTSARLFRKKRPLMTAQEAQEIASSVTRKLVDNISGVSQYTTGVLPGTSDDALAGVSNSGPETLNPYPPYAGSPAESAGIPLETLLEAAKMLDDQAIPMDGRMVAYTDGSGTHILKVDEGVGK
jgi:hypothetical protein